MDGIDRAVARVIGESARWAKGCTRSVVLEKAYNVRTTLGKDGRRMGYNIEISDDGSSRT